MLSMIRGAAFGSALIALAGCSSKTETISKPVESESAADFILILKPVLDEADEVSAIEVKSIIDGPLASDGPFSMRAPVVYAATAGIADRVTNLEVTDANGPVPLTVEDDDEVPGGFPYYRHWRANREVVFPVSINYSSAVQPEGSRGGPPFGIRSSAGGVSGAGSGFLVIPENVEADLNRVEWDLSAFDKPSAGIASFGEGAFDVAGPPFTLTQGWYMAGPVERYPASGDQNGFSASWLGDFPFDEQAAMHWAGEVYQYLGDYFGYLDPAPRYRVFMRLMETQPYGGGTALPNSFMLSRGPAREDEIGSEGPRGTFTHEMVHQWVGGIDAPDGISSWFSEGLTTYYTHVLSMRGGFVTIDEFLDGLNGMAARYYGNPDREMSAEAITRVGFGGNANDVRHLPYYRGALYFADLDAKLRGASGGEMTLDKFMRIIFEKRENDPDFNFDHAKWIELVSAEIGSGAKEEFESVILDGAVITPGDGAFGPCFRKEPVTYEKDGLTLDGVKWVRLDGPADEECRTY